MSYVFLIVGFIGMISCAASAWFHAVDGDWTGSMTWILAFGVNGIVFIFSLFEIKESRRRF